MTKLTHVLFLPRWYPNPEDPQLGVFIQKHAKAAALNHRVTVIYPFGIADQPLKYDVHIHSSIQFTEVSVYYSKSTSKLVNNIRYFWSYYKAKKTLELRWKDVDLCHVNIMAKPAVVAWLLLKLYKIPYIITEQWSGYTIKSGLFLQKPAWQQRIWRKLTTQATLIITVSNFLKKAMMELKLGKNLKPLPNVVEDMEVEFPKDVPDDVKLLNVSDLVDETKNISGLLRAMRTAIKHHPTMHLDIVGGGKDEAMLRQLCTDYQLDSHVTFHGRVTNDVVYEFMKRTQIVVINSHFETFSVVAAEGLICGKPVISTDCGGPSEFISERVGTLIPVNNDERLAAAIMRVVTTLVVFDNEYIHKYAKRKFSYEAIGNKLAEYYKEVIANPDRRDNWLQ